MSVIFLNNDISEVTANDLEELKATALQSPLKRARICLHHDHDDCIQEMVIALARGSYVRPHRHVSKVESIFLIDGTLEVVFFDDCGKVTNRILMESGNAKSCMLYRLSRDYWHTVIPISEFAIIHEICQGPFVKEDNYAPWSPQQDDVQAVDEYIMGISDKLVKGAY